MKNIISSTQNILVKELDKLKNAKDRKQQGKFLAEGVRTCGTLLSAELELLQIYATQQMSDIAAGMAQPNKITIVSDSVMNKISASTNPSGLICLFKIPTYTNLTLHSGIVLANITDPGNMGTLIRSAAAMGIKTVIVVEGTDPWGPKVIQASAGTIGQVDVFQFTWQQLIENKGYLKLCALVVSSGKNPNEIEFKDVLLVVGNEANGLPENWLKNCDEKMRIPMQGNVESLNAAIAGSIALYIAFGKK